MFAVFDFRGEIGRLQFILRLAIALAAAGVWAIFAPLILMVAGLDVGAAQGAAAERLGLLFLLWPLVSNPGVWLLLSSITKRWRSAGGVGWAAPIALVVLIAILLTGAPGPYSGPGDWGPRLAGLLTAGLVAGLLLLPPGAIGAFKAAAGRASRSPWGQAAKDALAGPWSRSPRMFGPILPPVLAATACACVWVAVCFISMTVDDLTRRSEGQWLFVLLPVLLVMGWWVPPAYGAAMLAASWLRRAIGALWLVVLVVICSLIAAYVFERLTLPKYLAPDLAPLRRSLAVLGRDEDYTAHFDRFAVFLTAAWAGIVTILALDRRTPGARMIRAATATP